MSTVGSVSTWNLPSGRLYLSGVKDTHRVLFESPFQRHTAHWVRKIFPDGSQRPQQVDPLCVTERRLISAEWGVLRPLTALDVWLFPPESGELLTSLLLSPPLWASTHLYLKSAGAPRKRGTFGRGRWKAPASTHPSVSMVWMTLPIQ